MYGFSGPLGQKCRFGGKWGRDGAMLTPRNLFLLLGVLTSVPVLVKIDQEMRLGKCAQTDTQIHTLTDANRASALLAMQTAVQARAMLSVCLSVCPVTFRCFVQRNEDTIVRFSASGNSTIILVSGEVKFIRIFAGYHPESLKSSALLSLAKI